MYHKIKSTLAGLGMVAAFLAAGLTLGEPVARAQPVPAAAIGAHDEAHAIVLKTVLAVAAAEAAKAAAREAELTQDPGPQLRARASRLRLELGMPYYSFGAVLPRRGES